MKDETNYIYFQGGNVNKMLNRNYTIDHIPDVQNRLYFLGITCPKVEFYTIKNSYSIEYSYKYITGKSLTIIGEESFEEVDNFIKHMSLINCEDICVLRFWDKIDFYKENIKLMQLDLKIVMFLKLLETRYNAIKKQYLCNTIIHGDLDITNIIEDKKYCFIDFDECCLGPQQMDWTIFIIRLFRKVTQGKVLWNGQMNQLTKKVQNLDSNLVEMYIYKIIVEKIYYEQQMLIDYNCEEQKLDSYESWINFYYEIGRLNEKR